MGNAHELASKGDVEGVRKFLQKSASKVDKKNRAGETALHCAAKGYEIEVNGDTIHMSLCAAVAPLVPCVRAPQIYELVRPGSMRITI